MRSICYRLFVFQFLALPIWAQQGEWTWMKGDNLIGSAGNFGVKGVASPTNCPQAGYSYVPWTDLNGNFWIFGGNVFGNEFSDLWKYDPVTNEWTWVKGTGLPNQFGVYGTKGIPAPNNNPGARTYGARSWTDNNGYLWLCGGDGYASNGGGELNDMWRYDITSNEWTWMNGSNQPSPAGVYGIYQTPGPLNTPGGRHEGTACWKDLSGNLWFYGGYDGSSYCDMWKYDPSTNEWAWMNGTSGYLPPNYGVKGIPSLTNTPGSRLSYSHFVDDLGNFWLFGGANVNIAPYADLWKYDPVSNQWTWMGGSQTLSTVGNTGALCDTSSLYYPAARFENRCSWSSCNRFWIIGGTSDFFQSALNDLWVFDPTTLEWAWVNGSLSPNVNATTGIQGVSDPSNNPGGLICSVGFVDSSNNLYEFAGAVGGGSLNPLNNLWRYVIDQNCPALNYSCISMLPQTSFAASDTIICQKFCMDFFDQSGNNPTTWQWSFPGGVPSSSNQQNPTQICYNNPGVYDVTLIATNAYGTDTLTLTGYITVNATPAFPTITVNGNVLTSSNASSYQWQFNSVDIPGATNQSYTATQTGYYTVIIADENGCVSSATVYIDVTGIENIADDFGFSVYPNPSTGDFTVELSLLYPTGDAINMEIINTLGQVMVTEFDLAAPFKKDIHIPNAGEAIYFLRLKCKDIVLLKKILVTQSK